MKRLTESVAAAISEFRRRRRDSKITEQLNKVYSKQPSKLDPGLEAAQAESIARETW